MGNFDSMNFEKKDIEIASRSSKSSGKKSVKSTKSAKKSSEKKLFDNVKQVEVSLHDKKKKLLLELATYKKQEIDVAEFSEDSSLSDIQFELDRIKYMLSLESKLGFIKSILIFIAYIFELIPEILGYNIGLNGFAREFKKAKIGEMMPMLKELSDKYFSESSPFNIPVEIRLLFAFLMSMITYAIGNQIPRLLTKMEEGSMFGRLMSKVGGFMMDGNNLSALSGMMNGGGASNLFGGNDKPSVSREDILRNARNL
jgi:hypothetical protein